MFIGAYLRFQTPHVDFYQRLKGAGKRGTGSSGSRAASCLTEAAGVYTGNGDTATPSGWMPHYTAGRIRLSFLRVFGAQRQSSLLKMTENLKCFKCSHFIVLVNDNQNPSFKSRTNTI